MRLLAGRSIAVRLVVSAVFWSGVVLLVAGLILTALYREATERGFDERLLVYANDLAADLANSSDEQRGDVGSHGDPRFDLPLSGWYWEVGRVGSGVRDLRSSRSLIGNPLPTLAEPSTDRPFGQVRKGDAPGPEDRMLRVLERDIDLGEDGRFVVRVAGPADDISATVRRFMLALVVTFLLVGLALGVSTLLQIRFGLKPLLDLRAAVGDIRRGGAERIPGRYPGDVAPLADELNLLLDSNREILERARTQVGNLAHALKTPLSVIVNEADHPAGDVAGVVREQAAIMRDQVEYYLTRARAAATAGALGATTDVASVLAGLTRTFAKIYPERQIAITLSVPEGLRFRGERQDLEEMAGNLIDNGCKWARTRVRVTASAGGGQPSVLSLAVEDDGPGLPDAARAEVLKRGRRLDETKPGSGLGLSIVVELAAHYGGRLELGPSPIGGACARLELPGSVLG